MVIVQIQGWTLSKNKNEYNKCSKTVESFKNQSRNKAIQYIPIGQLKIEYTIYTSSRHYNKQLKSSPNKHSLTFY